MADGRVCTGYRLASTSGRDPVRPDRTCLRGVAKPQYVNVRLRVITTRNPQSSTPHLPLRSVA
jgi:hypothetical protein